MRHGPGGYGPWRIVNLRGGESTHERTARQCGTAEGRDRIDWIAAEKSPEFQELVKTRNRFVVPATIFFLVWYLGFILLAAQATDFMGKEFMFDGLTVGYVLALSQFVMVWVLAWAYIRQGRARLRSAGRGRGEEGVRRRRGPPRRARAGR